MHDGAPHKATPPSRLGRGIAGALSVTLVVGIVLVAVVATGAKKNNNKSGAGASDAEPPRLITGAVGCPSRSYYAGARAACLAEVPDASHCPDDFPTWTEDGTDEPDCALAVVGAGAGGLYAAWRLVEAGTYAAVRRLRVRGDGARREPDVQRPLRRARPGGGRGRLPHLARVHARRTRSSSKSSAPSGVIRSTAGIASMSKTQV